MQTLDSETKKWLLLNQKRLEVRAVEIFKEFRSSGIEPILIKGWAAAKNYPPDQPRPYSDVDLAVSSADFEAANDLVAASRTSLSGVDLHNELRHLDTVSWRDLFSRSTIVELDDGSIRILSPEDHLRVMAVHWLNDGGTNKERLWDIFYAVANRPKTFDWSLCLDSVTASRSGWVICSIGLAHKYLDLKIDDLPFRDEASTIPKWVINTVEKEWARKEPLQPLQTCLRDPKLFFRQLARRFPPNPIQATIQMNESIDETGRTSIRFRNVIQRTKPSLKRIFEVLRRRG